MLGNKIDGPRAASEQELRDALGLNQTTGKVRDAARMFVLVCVRSHTGTPLQGKNCPPDIRPIELFMCSLVKQMGYGEGFQWLANYLK